MSEITIRTLYTTKELNAAVELQKVYWGEDAANLVPYHMLLSIARYGGHVHGAFDGDKLVGLLFGFLGAMYDSDTDNASQRLMLMSKRMVVLPEYRGHKIAERLKLVQRDFALNHQIHLITWTVDPFLSPNAYLNLHKLGAVIQKFVPDYFGSEFENPIMNADRVVVTWWINHPHLQERQFHNLLDVPLINTVNWTDDDLPVPHEFNLTDSDILRFEMPINMAYLEKNEPVLAQHWHEHLRFAFQNCLAAGYIATDFMRLENRVFYVFTRDDGTFTF